MAKLTGSTINPKKFSRSQIKFYLILLPVAAFMLLPLIYTFCHSLKPLDELFAFPPKFLVHNPPFATFNRLFQAGSTTFIPMSRYLFNSIVVTVLTVVINWVITVLAAYALSKKRFKFCGKLVSINQTALMFVGTALSIPSYFIISKIGLINSFWANIIPLVAMPVGLFLVKQFMDQTPDELIESAKLDGANDFQTVWKIIVPIVKPALATVGILTFQGVWNNTSTSSLYIQEESLKTFAYYLNTLTMTTTGNSIIGVGMQAAASVIIFVPNLIIFIFMQSKVMNTMAHSGIK